MFRPLQIAGTKGRPHGHSASTRGDSVSLGRLGTDRLRTHSDSYGTSRSKKSHDQGTSDPLVYCIVE